MCGRYTLATPDPADIRARFPVGETVEIRRRYNVAPGDDVLAVTTDKSGEPRGELLRWGLVPSWASVPDGRMKMINARAETVTEKPAFRQPFGRFRCLIIADGFYEWGSMQPEETGSARGGSTGARNAPTRARNDAFHIAPADGAPFAFAGLWSIWRGREGARLRSCTILTVSANAAVAPLHDRMPVILQADVEGRWLDPSTPREELIGLLAPLSAEQTLIRPVGPAVNDARYDGPQCLAAPAVSAQATLF